jgi:phage FluMu protein Com
MTDEKTREYMKNYYEAKKDHIKSYAIEKIECVCCNKKVSRCNWNKHIKTKAHLRCEELNKIKSNETQNIDDLTDELIKTQAIKILD